MVNRVDKIEAHTVNLIQSNSLFSRYTKDINNNKLKFTYDFDVSCPPFPNKMTYRTKLVNEITKDIKENNTYYVLDFLPIQYLFFCKFHFLNSFHQVYIK